MNQASCNGQTSTKSPRRRSDYRRGKKSFLPIGPTCFPGRAQHHTLGDVAARKYAALFAIMVHASRVRQHGLAETCRSKDWRSKAAAHPDGIPGACSHHGWSERAWNGREVIGLRKDLALSGTSSHRSPPSSHQQSTKIRAASCFSSAQTHDPDG